MMQKSAAYTPVYAQDDGTAVDGSDNNNTADLENSLLAAPPATGTVQATGQTLMEVTAPATLPEGYEFQVVVGNLKFNVQVPPGGVEEGQKFTVPMMARHAATSSGPMAVAQVSIPVGHWRDDLTGIFSYGACHPHCWTACCCALLAAGQVIRRLQFTWRGTPSPTTAASARAFAIVLYITIFHWFTIAVLYVTSLALNPNDYSKPEPITGWEKPTGTLLVVMVLFDIFKYMYYGITVWLLYNLRVSVRAKYAIPGNEGDDCCCSFWCPCLVAGQLLRHTTDYDVYPSQLCTDTGLPARTPMIV